MYAPASDEPEWVELMNCSSDTINLRNWRISDNNVASKSTISPTNLLVPPNGFCIVTKEANFISFHPTISCPVIVSSFSPLNNTTPDAIVIYDQRVITMDSIAYSPAVGGQAGKSLERIDIDRPSTDSKNWGTSQDSGGSTPGRANSIVRLDRDLSVDPCYQSRVVSGGGLIQTINCIVHNVGKKTAESYSTGFYLDSNRDGVADPGELIALLNSSTPLSPMDSAVCSYSWSTAPQGESTVLAGVQTPGDQRSRNNYSCALFRTCYNSHSVVVNEIMYDPLGSQNEWIELYNRSSDIVDMKNWKIKDRPTPSGSTNSCLIASQSIIVRTGEYVVVTSDSSIFTLYPDLERSNGSCHVLIVSQSAGLSLGNDGDDIILKDLTEATIDSVSYSPRWHRPDVTDTKGRSLERINPDLDSNSPYNWTTSVMQTGGTPGKPNSSYTASPQSASSLTFSPNPFSPDGDGFEDYCIIAYRLPLNQALIHVKIFDLKGRLVRILANSQISASGGQIIWDGMDEQRQKVRIGPYIVLIQAADPDGKKSAALKGVVVVATRL